MDQVRRTVTAAARRRLIAVGQVFLPAHTLNFAAPARNGLRPSLKPKCCAWLLNIYGWRHGACGYVRFWRTRPTTPPPRSNRSCISDRQGRGQETFERGAFMSSVRRIETQARAGRTGGRPLHRRRCPAGRYLQGALMLAQELWANFLSRPDGRRFEIRVCDLSQRYSTNTLPTVVVGAAHSGMLGATTARSTRSGQHQLDKPEIRMASARLAKWPRQSKNRIAAAGSSDFLRVGCVFEAGARGSFKPRWRNNAWWPESWSKEQAVEAAQAWREHVIPTKATPCWALGWSRSAGND